MNGGRPDVTVVFPCLNEEASIGRCVRDAHDAFAGAGMTCDVIVADNGSTDRSARLAAEAGARVIDVRKRGYGAAVSSAIDAARSDVILTADGDGTYPIEDGPLLVKAALDGDAIVLGSRFAGRILPGAMPALHRLVGSPATRAVLRVLFGVRSSDPHSGMRAMKRSVFERVRPTSTGWEFTVEMLLNAARRSVPVREIPIEYRPRSGESKLRALPEGWGFLRFLVLHSPTFLFLVPGLAAMSIGIALLVWLVPADRQLGSVELGINSLVVGSLATIVGYQVAALGSSARVYMSARDPESLWRPPFLDRWFTLERGIVIGGVVLLGGLLIVASVAARWLATDFGILPRSDHGRAIVGLTAAVVGMQTIFVSFFLSLLRGDRS